MKKIYVVLLTILCLMGFGLSNSKIEAANLTYSFEITVKDFNTTSYTDNNNVKTSIAKCTSDSSITKKVKWVSYSVMNQQGVMQWKKNEGSIYNTTPINIESVVVTKSSGTFTTYYGTTEKPSSGTTVSGSTYFNIKVGSSLGKTSKIVVTFTESNDPVTITLNGTNNPTNSRTENPGTTIDLGTPTSEGSYFAGWYSDSNYSEASKVKDPANYIVPTKDVTLYAKWLHIYSVEFYKDDSLNDLLYTKEVVEGDCVENVTQPAQYIDGIYTYTFENWYTINSNNEEVVFDFNTPITEYTFVYGVWSKVPTIYNTFKDVTIDNKMSFIYKSKTVLSTVITTTCESRTSNNNTPTDARLDIRENVFGKDNLKYITSIERVLHNATNFAGISGNELVFYGRASNTENDYSELIFTFAYNVKNITVTYSSNNRNNNRIDLIVNGNTTKCEENVKIEVNSSTFSLKNNCTGSSSDSSASRVYISQISFELEAPSSTYSDFNNVQIQNRYEFNVSNNKEVTECGLFVSTNSNFRFDSGIYTNDSSSVNYINTHMATKAGEKGATEKYVNKNNSNIYTLGINVPTVIGNSFNYRYCNVEFRVAAYIVVDGVYYFSQVKTYTLNTFIDQYLELLKDNQEIVEMLTIFKQRIEETK